MLTIPERVHFLIAWKDFSVLFLFSLRVANSHALRAISMDHKARADEPPTVISPGAKLVIYCFFY